MKITPKKSEGLIIQPKQVREQLKHSEIHSKIQKQRQEMLLMKQKNLNEFRNQLKLEHEKSHRHLVNESFTKSLDTNVKVNRMVSSTCKFYRVFFFF